MYYEDYLKLNKEAITNKLKPLIHNNSKKKIICLNNKTIYNSIAETAIDTNCSASTISMCCNHKIQSTKGHKFMFYNEYTKIHYKEIN